MILLYLLNANNNKDMYYVRVFIVDILLCIFSQIIIHWLYSLRIIWIQLFFYFNSYLFFIFKLSGSYCMLGFVGIDATTIPFLVLGDVFIRNYFFALDKTNN